MNTELEKLAQENPVNVLSIGLNMKNKKIITKSILYFNGTKFLLKNNGLNMVIDNTDDLFIENSENREKLEKICKQK